MVFTLEQAVKKTGKSKRAISQAIKAGTLPAKKGERGQWQIDPEALFQVFPKQAAPAGREREEAPAVPGLESRMGQLEQEVQSLRQELAQAQEQLRGLKLLLAQEAAARQRLAERLAAQKPAQKRGLWSRWFSRGG